MSGLLRNRILVGDVRERMAEIPNASIDCVITSPPYYQLRDYRVRGQIGHEASVDGWVDELRVAINGLARVLKPSGSLWLNLGDTYSRHTSFGAPPKSLLLAPEKLLLALAGDGWIARNKVVWSKTRHLPSSVTDRLTNSYEFVYFLTREPRYFFDLDAIRQPHRTVNPRPRRARRRHAASTGPWGLSQDGGGLEALKMRGLAGHPLGRNPGDVWALAPADFRGAHFATFPPKLVEPALLATCPELICDACGAPFRRKRRARPATTRDGRPERRERRVIRQRHPHEAEPLLPGCRCGALVRPGVVLDPFFGAGTVGLVAEQHGRDWIGIELNPSYAKLAERRLDEARARRKADGPPVDGTAKAVALTDKPSIPERGNEP